MLNQLLKFTLLSSLLLWLRPRWKSLLALAAGVLLVHVFHGEYLDYVQLSGDDAFLIWSYAVKWVALLLIAGAYLAYLMLGAKASTPPKRSAFGSKSGGKPGGKSSGAQETPTASATGDDGFDFLREKKTLQKRADQIIAGKDKH